MGVGYGGNESHHFKQEGYETNKKMSSRTTILAINGSSMEVTGYGELVLELKQPGREGKGYVTLKRE